MSVSTDSLGSTALVGADLVHRLCASEFEVICNQSQKPRFGLIEVYPAASLSQWLGDKKAYSGYKTKPQLRAQLAQRLIEAFHVPQAAVDFKNDHEFDAFICALSGREFLAGNCLEPQGIPQETLEKEGWAWFPMAGLGRQRS